MRWSSPTAASTWCTRTRCCSTSAIRCGRCGRCGACARRADWWLPGTATTRRSRGTRGFRSSTSGWRCTSSSPGPTAASRTRGECCCPGRGGPASATSPRRRRPGASRRRRTGTGGAGCGRTGSCGRRWRTRPGAPTRPPRTTAGSRSCTARSWPATDSDRITNGPADRRTDRREGRSCTAATVCGMSDQTTVLVTGASSGFGAAIARRFAAGGARVVAAARRTDRLRELADELGESVLPVEVDVTDDRAVAGLVDGLPAEFAAIDVLVNNAGLALGLEPAQRAELDDWDRMLDTNCKGLVHVTRAVLPGMVERGRGHVVNLGSVAGTYQYPGGNVYG